MRERIDGAEPRNLFRDRNKCWNEFISRGRIQNFHDEIAHCCVPFFVGLDPTRVEFRFMQRLGHVRLNSFGVIRCRRRFWFAVGLHWPCPQQSLIEQVFFIRVRGFDVVDRSLPATSRSTPPLQRASPKLRDFRNRHYSSAHIFTAFCVVCRSGQQRRGPIVLSINIPLVKCRNV